MNISHQLKSHQQKPRSQVNCIWNSFSHLFQAESTMSTVAEERQWNQGGRRAFLSGDTGGIFLIRTSSTRWAENFNLNSWEAWEQHTFPSPARCTISFGHTSLVTGAGEAPAVLSFKVRLQGNFRDCYLSCGWPEFLQRHAVSANAALHILPPGASPQTTETHKARALMEATHIGIELLFLSHL